MGNARCFAHGIDALGREVKLMTTKSKALSEVRAGEHVMLRTTRFETAIEVFNGLVVAGT